MWCHLIEAEQLSCSQVTPGITRLLWLRLRYPQVKGFTISFHVHNEFCADSDLNGQVLVYILNAVTSGLHIFIYFH